MSGRTAVVTGGTRGIGAAITARLARDGWRAIAVARREPDADALAAGVTYRRCDVADAEAVRALFAGLDRLDALVNNAGTAATNRLEAEDDALWHSIIGCNLHATYYCSTAALRLLPEGTGRIVNIASTLGLRGVADQTAYCAAKHGVIGFTRALAQALAPRGITVNAVCPGWVDTDMAARRFATLGISRAEATADMPIGRIVTPAEVGEAVAFLLGPGAGAITGHALAVDGGSLAAP
jgi:NAD(P)-dependent dehydrogenase (short-subunit alcohol dehydrogenase family)